MRNSNMTTELAIYSLVIAATAVSAIEAQSSSPSASSNTIAVTADNFTRAETDTYFANIVKGKLVGLHNYIGLERYRAVSTENVPAGKVSLTFDFKYDGGGMSKGGTITLLANGKNIGEARVNQTAGFKYSLYEGQDIGEDSGSPVDFDYTPPFKFKGKIGKVTVDLK